MNEFFSMLILAIVQGITEWLPISSDGHLVLFQHLMNYNPGLSFDVALHLGTFLAVVFYFWKDLRDIGQDVARFNFKSENGRTFLLIVVATLPLVIIALLFRRFFEMAFESLGMAALGFAITAIVLLISTFDFANYKKKIDFGDALFVGISQVLAPLPGVSRSGMTISAGLLRGLTEEKALRFSFLMSIPAVLGAFILEYRNVIFDLQMLIAIAVSFFVGLASIHFLLKFISKNKNNLRWFAAYLMILALTIGYYLMF